MSGFPILCVTDRTLCAPRFLAQVEAIAAARPAGLILREKDLPEADYQALASDVLRICKRYEVPCILHTFVGAAKALGVKYIHLPLSVLRAQSKQDLAGFDAIGVSCHSVAEALEAQALGATGPRLFTGSDPGCVSPRLRHRRHHRRPGARTASGRGRGRLPPQQPDAGP